MLHQCISWIYNSRNYNGVLNRWKDSRTLGIYNSRNYNGVLNAAKYTKVIASTIVEIITEY